MICIVFCCVTCDVENFFSAIEAFLTRLELLVGKSSTIDFFTTIERETRGCGEYQNFQIAIAKRCRSLSRSVDELCELKAELFAITYTRYQSVQISLKFVYGGTLPTSVEFTRTWGSFVHFTEWHFEAVGRISSDLQVFRKIPPVMFWSVTPRAKYS